MKRILRICMPGRDKLTDSSQKSDSSAPASPAPAPVSPQPATAPMYSGGYGGYQQPVPAAADGLTVALQNRTASRNVYAYITGLSIAHNNAPIFIQSDGRTIYHPTSPGKTLSPLSADVAIRLGAPGSTTNVTIPKIAGGRIWFSIDAPLQFYLNPGPAIVEPSVTNTSDANINTSWTFCEFTYNDAQLFANISYVDFVSIPIALSLTNANGQTQHVPGLPANGFDAVVNALRAQAAQDGQPWDKLIHSHNGRPLRALSPNNLRIGDAAAFANYWEPYIARVWSKYASQDLIINTQAAPGNLRGRINRNGLLDLGPAGTFPAPSSTDIWTCSTGPFATGGNPARNAVIPRLAAAFNRSTLLDAVEQPNGSNEDRYYRDRVTNHYSRVLHQLSRDGRGYGFPYDDVVPDGGRDVAGVVYDGAPVVFGVAVGGG